MKLSSALLLVLTTVSGAQAQMSKPSDQTIIDAYTYLLGRDLVIRQEHLDRGDKGTGYNTIHYNPLGSADFANPNFDVAYFEAWIAVDDNSAAVIEVPEINNRYYTVEVLDEWAEVITNINDRAYPSKPFGKYAFVTPGSKVSLPSDVSPIVLHSSKAKILGRVEIKGDPAGAVELQHGFKVTTIGNPLVAPPPPIKMFNNQDLIGVEIFEGAEKRMASALDVAPNAAEMQQKVRSVAAYAVSSADAKSQVSAVLGKFIPDFRENVLVKYAPYVNHWLCGATGGNYGMHYDQRTGANYTGIWANNPREVVYFGAVRDASDNVLEGSNSYVMHFPANALPDAVVSSYWSVILVSFPEYRVVPNALKRYNFNTYSALKKEADGSLKIAIGPKPVSGIPEANWLPSPDGKRFSLTFRAYVPKDGPQKCEWAPPAVTKLE